MNVSYKKYKDLVHYKYQRHCYGTKTGKNFLYDVHNNFIGYDVDLM